MYIGFPLGRQRLLVAAVVLLAALNVAQLIRRPGDSQPDEPPVISDREVSDRYFVILAERTRGLQTSTFMGIQTLQNPLDVWITQEIIHEVKPDFIVETGTHKGGSAALWAMLLEQVSPNGRVITIDVKDDAAAAKALPVVQRRVDFLIGSSTDPEIVAEVARRVAGGRVLAILDSLHTKPHVLRELELYSPLVVVGSYLIVQDTVVDRRDADWERARQTREWARRITPGVSAGAAVEAFLARHDGFEIDTSRERFLVTNNWNGFLKRVE